MSNLIWAVILAAGIPSAIVGFLINRLNKKIDKREAEKAEKEKAHNESLVHLIDLTTATMSLARATAAAVERIPDAHCNGDMHKALELADSTLNKYQKFANEQMVKATN